MAKLKESLLRAQALAGTEGGWYLAEFLIAMDKGETPPVETMRFLYEAITKILAGVEPKKALKLQRGRGRKVTVKRSLRGERIATRVHVLRESMPLDDAHARVGTEVGLSEDQIKQLYAKHKDSAIVRLRFDECLAKTEKFLPLLEEEVRSALLNWSPGDIADVFDLWESSPDLTPDGAVDAYLTRLKHHSK